MRGIRCYISHGRKLRFFTTTEFSPPRREERQDFLKSAKTTGLATVKLLLASWRHGDLAVISEIYAHFGYRNCLSNLTGNFLETCYTITKRIMHLEECYVTT